jgi:hypothetical protein
MMEPKYCGPSGGTGGQEFSDDIDLQDCQVLEVHIYAGKQVHAIQIIHETCTGERHVFPLRGRTTGDCYILKLADDEFIVGISGRFSTQVNSIRIQTTKQASPLLGGAGGSVAYQYEAPPGTEVVGFCGRAGNALDAIGVILRRRGL